MKKNKGIYILFTLILVTLSGTMFFSCKKNGLKNNIQFVEVNFKDEDKPEINLFIGRTEITQAQYQEVIGKNPSVQKDELLPVTNITYQEACEFCNKLNKIYGFPETYKISSALGSTEIKLVEGAEGFRLLTETESKAIIDHTAVTKEGYWWWKYVKENEGWHGSRLHKVAHFKPDSTGLFDFGGNAKELVIKVIENTNSEDSEYHYEAPHVYINTEEKYKNEFPSEEDLTGFRICCPVTINKSNLDIIYQKDVEAANIKWEKDAVEELFSKLKFVQCSEYSYQADGENADKSKSKINIYVPELNICTTEVTKELYSLVMEGKKNDGITLPDHNMDYYSHSNYKPEDYAVNSTEKTNIRYDKAIEFCNRLSELRGLSPCYKKANFRNHKNQYKLDLTKNGYRLPTGAEFISFNEQHNSSEEISFDSTHWNWTADAFSEQLYTTDMYDPFYENPDDDVRVYRWAGKSNASISIKVRPESVKDYREPDSPNFCLRLFQTADTKQMESYNKKQLEVTKAKLSEVFDSLIKMNPYEGGIKDKLEYLKILTGYENGFEVYKYPEIELADYELSDTNFSNYLFKTIMGQFILDDKYQDKDYINMDFNTMAEVCNKLSSLQGLEECYYLNDDVYECDYTKNGYRLPTLAEYASSNSDTNTLCNDYFISAKLYAVEKSFPHGNTHIKGEEQQHCLLWRTDYEEIECLEKGTLLLCRTTNTDAMKSLLKKNKEEKKQLKEQLDEYLGMVLIDGGKYTMTYTDSETKKEVKKSSDIKSFYIMSNKFPKNVAKDIAQYYNPNESGRKFAEETFLQTLVLCNKLSIMANLTPVYNIEGKFLLDNSEIEEISSRFSYSSKEPKKDYSIIYDTKADGYQLCSEIEWEYAGVYKKEPDSKTSICWITDRSEDKSEPTPAGLYLMNTNEPEWCYDRGPVFSYPSEKWGEVATYYNETRVVRYYCGEDEIKVWRPDYWGHNYEYTLHKRGYSGPGNKYSFRVIRYK